MLFRSVTGAQQPRLAWIPSYWFVGLYQQVSGSLHPALAPFARRAWVGLIAAIVITAAAYTASYLRTLRKIVEEPDIAPGSRSTWLPEIRLPSFGGSFETAIVQFSIRSLLRSRRHRMIFSFYLGVGLAFAIVLLNAPRELAGATQAGPWEQLSVPLLASSITLMGVSVVGARKIFSLPLDPHANWIFRMMPFDAGPRCLSARRRALLAVSVAPVWAISAALLFSLWPWRVAAAHLVALLFIGIILAEFAFDGVQRIPFTCSYIPGRSKLYLTFWLWIYILLAGIVAAAVNERDALKNPTAAAALLAGLGIAAASCVFRNHRVAARSYAELRFEEIPPDQLLSLDLS